MNRVKSRDRGEQMRSRRTRRTLTALAAVGLTLSGCDLAVTLPGDITEEELAGVESLPLLVTSAEGVFECAYQQYVLLSGKVGDEWMSGGSDGAYYIYDQRTITEDTGGFAGNGCPGGQLSGLYTPLSQARWFADDNLGRAQEVGDQGLVARSAAVAGYSYVLFGEGFCSAAFDQGPELTPPEVLALAEERFTTAIAAAESAGLSDIVNLAHLGRARARLNLGKLSDAAADARQVPDGFVYYATRSSSDNTRRNHLFGSNYIDRNIEIHPRFWDLEFQGVPDPRVELIHTGGFGRNGLNPEVLQTKYTSYDADIPIGRYEEALLIIAEAEGGQVAVGMINELHSRAGLPPFVSTDPEEIMDQVYQERMRELFLEGHRLNDMLRLGVPFPSGTEPFNNRTYGNTTCFPLPNIEKDNNPNIS